FDPFDSFAHVNKAFAEWGPIYAAHPELAKAQEQIAGALQSQRTIIAVRRDDLSYHANRIDLSKARFLRVLDVRLHPGHEGEVAERMQQIAREAYAQTESNLYAISPEKSHVSKEFAAGDPEFWTPRPEAPAKLSIQKREKSKRKH